MHASNFWRSVAALGFVLAALMTAAADESAEALKELKGTWQPIEAKIGEGELPKEILEKIQLVISEEGYTVPAGDKVDKGTFKLDAKAKPKTMDIIGKEGPNSGKTFLCIYEVSSDTLTVAYSFTGKDRPTEFKTGGDATKAVIKYERKK